MLVNTYAQVEQDMNCVERTINYAELPPEGASPSARSKQNSNSTQRADPLSLSSDSSEAAATRARA